MESAPRFQKIDLAGPANLAPSAAPARPWRPSIPRSHPRPPPPRPPPPRRSEPRRYGPQLKVASPPPSPDLPEETLSHSRKLASLICVCLMGVGSAYGNVPFSTLNPALTSETGEMKLNKSQFALAEGAFDASSLVLAFVGGYLMKVYGKTSGALITTISLVGSNAMVSIALERKSYLALLIGRLLMGFGAGSIEVVQRVMVAQWFSGQNIGAAMSVLLVITYMAETVGLATYLPLSKMFNLAGGSWAATLLSVFGVAAALFYFTLTRSARNKAQRQASLEPLSPNSSAQSKEEAPARGSQAFVPRAILHFSSSFWMLSFISLTSLAVFQVWRGEATDVLTERNNVSDVDTTIDIVAERTVAGLLGLALGGALDRFGNLITFSIFGHIILVVVFALIIFTKVSSLALMSVLGVASPLSKLASVVAIPILVPTGHLGTAFAFDAGVQAAGRIIINVQSARFEDGDEEKGEFQSIMCFFVASVIGLVFSLAWYCVDKVRYHGIVQRTAEERQAYMARKQLVERRVAAAKMDVTVGHRVRPIRATFALFFVLVINAAWILFLFTFVTNPIRRGGARSKGNSGKGDKKLISL